MTNRDRFAGPLRLSARILACGMRGLLSGPLRRPTEHSSRRRRRWPLVGAVVVALTASLSQILVATDKPLSPRDVPLLSSSAVDPRELGSDFAAPEADFAPLLADATVDFDSRTSTEVSRTEFGVEYANSNGSRSVVLSPSPVSLPDGAGGWAPVDTRLVPEPDSDRVAAARTGAEVSFAESAQDAALVSVRRGGAGITLGLEGAVASTREVAGSTAT